MDQVVDPQKQYPNLERARERLREKREQERVQTKRRREEDGPQPALSEGEHQALLYNLSQQQYEDIKKRLSLMEELIAKESVPMEVVADVEEKEEPSPKSQKKEENGSPTQVEEPGISGGLIPSYDAARASVSTAAGWFFGTMGFPLLVLALKAWKTTRADVEAGVKNDGDYRKESSCTTPVGEGDETAMVRSEAYATNPPRFFPSYAPVESRGILDKLPER